MQRKSTYKKLSISGVYVYRFAVVFAIYAIMFVSTVNTSAATTELVWTAKTGAAISDTPLVAGNRIYATSADKHLYCWDITSGKEIWKTRFKQRLYYSPVCSDGRIFVVETFSTGKIHAVDFTTGDKSWSVKIGKKVSRPVALEGKIVVASGKQIVTLRPTDGFVLERVVTGNNISSLSEWNGLLVATTVTGDIEFFDTQSNFISKLSLCSGGIFIYPSNDCLYTAATDGSVYKINQDLDIVWKYERDVSTFRNPIVLGDYVYSIAEGGSLAVLSDVTGELIKEIEIPGNVFSYTEFSGGLIAINELGKMFYVNQGELHVIVNGAVEGKYYGPVLSVNDYIYIAESKGLMYCYKVEMR